VKHIVPIDNDIRMHILTYSLIVIGHDAYVEHGSVLPAPFHDTHSPLPLDVHAYFVMFAWRVDQMVDHLFSRLLQF